MHASENVSKVLVANKADLEQDREVSRQEGEQLAASLGVNFFETSAKTGQNIEDLFTYIAEIVKAKLDEEEQVGVLTYTGSKLLKRNT